MIRLLEDNVAIKLEPLNQQHGVIHVVREKVKVEQRLARVLACGPGHHTEPSVSAPPSNPFASRVVIRDCTGRSLYVFF